MIKKDVELLGIPESSGTGSVGNLWEYDRFGSMASHMGVSRQALAIRMRQLHLLAEDVFPWTRLDICMEA